MKSHTSAVVILPPESVWGQIQDIRRKYDRAFKRWMPHINMIYPFLKNDIKDCGKTTFDLEVPRIYKHIGHVKPFKIIFSSQSFSSFNHGNKSTIYLHPLVLAGEPSTPERPLLSADLQHSVNSEEEKIDVNHRKTSGSSIKGELIMAVEVEPLHLTTGMSSNSSGIEALEDAIWTPENTPRIPSAKSGIDALARAVWGTKDDCLNPGNKVVHPSGPMKLSTLDSETCIPIKKVKKTRWDSPVNESTSKAVCKASPVTADLNKVDNYVEGNASWTEIKKRKAKTDNTALDICSSPGSDVNDIVLLQQKLMELYPQCYELNAKSSLGFQPHLTLGQCKSNSVQQMINTISSSWRNISFLVNSVHLISRKDEFDPFVINKTIYFDGNCSV